MILSNDSSPGTLTGARVGTPSRVRQDCAGLDDTPASQLDRENFSSILGVMRYTVLSAVTFKVLTVSW